MTALILNLGEQLSAPNQGPAPFKKRYAVLALAVLVAGSVFFWFTRHNLEAGWVAGGSVALATALGALPVAFARRMPENLASSLMMIGGGIMATVTIGSVLPEAHEGMTRGMSSGVALSSVLVITVLGAWGFATWQASANKLAAKSGAEAERFGLLLFALAMTLQNLPEGIAAGVSMAGSAHGSALTFGISLQDIPEGFAVATALLRAGASPTKAALGGMASGLVELVGALIGAAALSVSAALLPVLLALAAGAMLWVIGKEMGPRLLARPGVLQASFATGLLIAVGFNFLPA
ncbi:ZIP family metal transporter [Silvimonas amylolytica]|uniref:ZIP family metal transporter n=1 Tax=Silvimonas amylolytica TaxID=449663 RepID=A0ABQ2PHH3_9NEIS|nr:ZIP family metal transporter [Silvimonas amylolytica]GGP24696.1 ZIP family metal transporter [Silvimonas amylolytica]